VFDFSLTPEQRSLRDNVREFGRTEIVPIAERCALERQLPPAVAEAWHHTGIPNDYYERPDDDKYAVMDGAIISEELGYADASFASYLMLPVFFNRLLLGYLKDDALSGLTTALDRGHVVTSFAASERAAGSDITALAVAAEKAQDGSYCLNGRKEYSTNIRYAQQVIVVARTSPEGGMNGMSWLLVPMDADGVSVGERWDTLGLRALDVSPLEMKNVVVPAAYRIGEEGKGIQLFNEHLAKSRTGIAAMAVGIARRARDTVMDFGLHRRVYGDKLTKMQDYRFNIVEMEKEIAAAKALVALSAAKADAGLDHTKEASLAKLYAGEMVMRVTAQAVLMLGSVGYTGQTVADKLMVDARHVAIVEGPEPIHKEIIFATMLRRGAY
jgi:alkylation response protein AidB-like acyl-CoA dehydrogenase